MQIDCVAFGAHPDDVELFCSGLLLKLKSQGYKTAIVDLTQGELSTNGDIKTRQGESEKASNILQLDFRVNAAIRDGHIVNDWENRMAIIKLIRKLKPTLCLIPYWEDRHPDHRNASVLLREALFFSGLTKIETEEEAIRPKTIIYYMLHNTFMPTFIVDISEEMDNKIAAIRVYKSQFENDPVRSKGTFINRSDFLETILIRAKYYGQKIGCSFGEPYYFDGALKINNIMTFFT